VSTHRGLRWRDDTGWELRCDQCADRRTQSFWPLTPEFWSPERGMGRCKACWNERSRLRRRRSVPEMFARAEELRSKKRRQAKREWMQRQRERRVA
jgi:hypothetical protein